MGIYFKALTLPETNIAPENRPGPKRKRSYSNHPLSGAMLNFRECNKPDFLGGIVVAFRGGTSVHPSHESDAKVLDALIVIPAFPWLKTVQSQNGGRSKLYTLPRVIPTMTCRVGVVR